MPSRIFLLLTQFLLGNWQRDKVCTQLIAFNELRLAFCCSCQCGHRNMAQQGEKKAVKDDRHPLSPFPRPSNPSLHPNDGVNVMANEKKKNETVIFENKESGPFSAFANAR